MKNNPKSLSHQPVNPLAEEEFLQPGETAQSPQDSVGLVETRRIRLFDGENKLPLECGRSLGPIDIAYETYGQLSERKDNAILICHALSGDAHVAGRHSVEDRKLGWWDNMVGPGKAFDTRRYFVICSNCLGGCMGTTGPSSIDPATNEPYGLNFPMITISDMVDLQRHLLDYLGVDKLLAVVGGSMGGAQVLDWATRYPDRVAAALPIATTSRLSAQGIAFDAVGRNAILTDKNYQNGSYYRSEQYPAAGLAVARMVAHITYLSEEAMHAKFGRKLQHADKYHYDLKNEFSVETYLDHQGSVFVDRFDANTYLYFTKAMDYFDLPHKYGSLSAAMERTKSRFLIISFNSDWLFTPRQSREMVDALLTTNKDVTYCNIDCPFGHDSFLLETRVQGRLIRGFLDQTYQKLSDQVIAKTVPDQKTAHSKVAADGRMGGSIFAGERVDHRQIAQLIDSDSVVLDLGCGDGKLLELLQEQKNIRGMGLTLGETDVQDCIDRGVSVVQYNLENGLNPFGDKRFDYVVLSQTLQVIRRPQKVLRELLRIGRQVIVSFPNLAYWRQRMQIFLTGRTPLGKMWPFHWYDRPEQWVNYMSIRDFEHFVQTELHAHVITRLPLSSRSGRKVRLWPNFFADEAIFVIAENHPETPSEAPSPCHHPS